MLIKTLSQIFIVGLAVRTANAPGQAEVDIPKLRERFYHENVAEKISNRMNNDLIVVYTDYEGDYQKPYTCLIGHAVSDLNQVPEGLTGRAIPAATYAVFDVEGTFPASLINAWGKVWKMTLDRTYKADFELYPEDFNPMDNSSSAIYIGIEK